MLLQLKCRALLLYSNTFINHYYNICIHMFMCVCRMMTSVEVYINIHTFWQQYTLLYLVIIRPPSPIPLFIFTVENLLVIYVVKTSCYSFLQALSKRRRFQQTVLYYSGYTKVVFLYMFCSVHGTHTYQRLLCVIYG